MKAVGYKTPGPIEHPEALVDLDLPMPQALGRDLLVKVRAISVNPVDTKVRKSAAPEGAGYKILGWDAAGVVEQAGADCSLFKAGDEVFYAGSIARPGTNAEFHLVDERIVGPKPRSLDFPHAAALPLTTLTAWELLFDRLKVPQGRSDPAGSLLIVGAAGGVGSILIQLARKLTNLTVIATASRPETRDWCLGLGAHHVIDHTGSFPDQLRGLGLSQVEMIASLNGTDAHFPALVDVLAPEGKFALIDDPKHLDATLLKRKAASLHWEFMFTRSLFQTPTLEEQHKVLKAVSAYVDEGVIRTTFAEALGAINATNLKKAHERIESGRAKGKVVLAGF
jgi:NADPH2:quinone reductase